MEQNPRRKAPLTQAVLGTVDDELRQLFYQALAKKRNDDAWVREARDQQRRFAGLYGTDSSNWPLLSHNTAPSTEVVGPPDLAQDVHTLLSIAPMLRGLVPKVINGPDATVFDLLRQSGFSDDNYDQTNLLGTFNPESSNISMNPRLSQVMAKTGTDGGERFATLAHEFGHAAGQGHDRGMSNIEGVARMRKEYMQRLLQQLGAKRP